MNHFHSLLQQVHGRHPSLELHICWVPSHTGVKDNECTDEAAKAAASRWSSHYRCLLECLCHLFPHSKTAAIHTFKSRLLNEHDQQWALSSRHKTFSELDTLLAHKASRNYLKLIKNLSRKQTSLLVQLRTEHVPLQEYLHCFQKINAPICSWIQIGQI
ncbi:hypothetical protein K435DRAFT_693753 [Dendrothele bispora CBS 962.96]|uniref:RNase H type-1 domain-containing protein n=1 Tax=Dendrothele bispora (strain CBS 962.96) TaxID=1314807 RepID=A0A4V4HBZ7_DENBC|nr:hypothetical protein K435DRAFT_693753 [Dendrothele bispora CBS 962.96]